MSERSERTMSRSSGRSAASGGRGGADRETLNTVLPGAVVVLPMGATEQHGPRLATGTDAMLATEVSRRAVGRADSPRRLVLAPTLSYGASDHHLPFGGPVADRGDDAGGTDRPGPFGGRVRRPAAGAGERHGGNTGAVPGGGRGGEESGTTLWSGTPTTGGCCRPTRTATPSRCPAMPARSRRPAGRRPAGSRRRTPGTRGSAGGARPVRDGAAQCRPGSRSTATPTGLTRRRGRRRDLARPGRRPRSADRFPSSRRYCDRFPHPHPRVGDGHWLSGTPSVRTEFVAFMDTAGTKRRRPQPRRAVRADAGDERPAGRVRPRYPDRLTGFGTVAPRRKTAVAEAERMFGELGLRGLKLHPWLQGFSMQSGAGPDLRGDYRPAVSCSATTAPRRTRPRVRSPHSPGDIRGSRSYWVTAACTTCGARRSR